MNISFEAQQIKDGKPVVFYTMLDGIKIGAVWLPASTNRWTWAVHDPKGGAIEAKMSASLDEAKSLSVICAQENISILKA